MPHLKWLLAKPSVPMIVAGLVFGMAPAAAQTYEALLIAPVDGAYFCPSGISGDIVTGGLVTGSMSQTTGRAAIWSSATVSATILNPPWSSWCFVNGVSGSHQAGMAGPDGGITWHALMWTGTAASIVDLNPAGCSASGAFAIDGTNVVGWAGNHAVLWRGDASSILDLHPATGYFASSAAAISGDFVAGCGVDDRQYGQHPLLWQVSTGAMIDLSPAGWGCGTATGVGGDEQVGVCGPHAVLWHGSAESAVLLTPTGFCQSSAAATNGSQEVGWGGLGYDPDIDGPTTHHALVWSGSADSYLDLQSYLPSGFVDSWATSIDAQGNIAGYALDARGQGHGVVWRHLAVPEPGGLALVLAGVAGLGGLGYRRRAARCPNAAPPSAPRRGHAE